MVDVRPFHPRDAVALRGIFRQAVLVGAAGHYDAAQRAAWAGAAALPPAWPARLGDQITLVAEAAGGPPLGFMTLGHDGHLDLAFVRPESRGTGVAAALLGAIVAEARARSIAPLTTEASHLARPFFLRHGWTLLAEQQVELNGITLTNFRMELRLD